MSARHRLLDASRALAAAVASILTLIAASAPSFLMAPLVLATVIWLVLGASWVARLVRATNRRGPMESREVIGFCVLPTLLLALVLVVGTGLPLEARFGREQRVMTEQAMADIKARRSREPGEKLAGFRLSESTANRRSATYLVANTGLLMSGGFYFSMDGRAPEQNEDYRPTRRLSKRWWAIRRASW